MAAVGVASIAEPSRKNPPRPGMVWIPGDTFRMGSDLQYPEEAPAHRVSVDAFWMDAPPVTNRQFCAFVAATGYATVTETKPDRKSYPGVRPQMFKPGSFVFSPPEHPVLLRDFSQWWTFKFGANWRHPCGPGSSIKHLCTPNYCRRYRPAARHPQPVNTSMSHIGFRCIIRDRSTP